MNRRPQILATTYLLLSIYSLGGGVVEGFVYYPAWKVVGPADPGLRHPVLPECAGEPAARLVSAARVAAAARPAGVGPEFTHRAGDDYAGHPNPGPIGGGSIDHGD